MKRRAAYLKILWSSLVLLALLAIFSGCSVSPAVESQPTPAVTATSAVPSRAPSTVTANPPASDEAQADIESSELSPLIAHIKDTTNTFWSFAKYKQWDNMWDMLHPDARSSYAGKDDFIQRSKEVFLDVDIKSFAISSVEFKKNQKGADYTEVQITFFISALNGGAQGSTSTTFFVVKYNNYWMPVLIWNKTSPDPFSSPIPLDSQEPIILY